MSRLAQKQPSITTDVPNKRLAFPFPPPLAPSASCAFTCSRRSEGRAPPFAIKPAVNGGARLVDAARPRSRRARTGHVIGRSLRQNGPKFRAPDLFGGMRDESRRFCRISGEQEVFSRRQGFRGEFAEMRRDVLFDNAGCKSGAWRTLRRAGALQHVVQLGIALLWGDNRNASCLFGRVVTLRRGGNGRKVDDGANDR